MSSNAQIAYRPDIDGLRAVAVLSVIAFHLGAPFLKGGFVGVDVFFVISGFLITAIITKKSMAGEFSVLDFYARRLRRILPPLIAMMLCTALAACWLLLPQDLEDLGDSMKFSILGFGNVYFNGNSQDYFARATELMPLLHTWSLGVEEQFYLAIPFILLAIAHFKGHYRHHILYTYGAIFVLSFCGSVWCLYHNRTDCFYLIQYRAWELAFGGLLTFIKPDLKKKALLGWTGLLLILLPCLLFCSQTSFPAHGALLPVLGAGLIIASGHVDKDGKQPRLYRMLSSKVMVAIGLLSYSLYLWHWPIIVFYKYLRQFPTLENGQLIPPSGLTAVDIVSIIILTAALAYASWRFIEKPWREPRRIWGLNSLVFIISAALLILGGGIIIANTDGLLALRSPAVLKVLEAKESYDFDGKHSLSRKKPAILRYGSAQHAPQVALIGDSHAQALARPLHDIGMKEGFSFLYYGFPAQIPLPGYSKPGAEKDSLHASQYYKDALQKISTDLAIHTVIINSRWSMYWKLCEHQEQTKALLQSPQWPTASTQIQGRYPDDLLCLANHLVSQGKRVVFVLPIPSPSLEVADLMIHELMMGRTPLIRIKQEAAPYFERDQFMRSFFHSFTSRPGIHLVDPASVLIRDGELLLHQEGECFYMDTNHLALAGSRLVAPLLRPFFNDPRQPSP